MNKIKKAARRSTLADITLSVIREQKGAGKGSPTKKKAKLR